MSRPTRVLTQFGTPVPTVIHEKFPEVDIVEVPVHGEVPTDVVGDVLLVHFDTGRETLLELCRRGVRWAHFYSSGVNRYPLDQIGPSTVLTCGRGSSAIPIAEFVLAAMLAVEKNIPAVWDPADPGRWRQPGEAVGVRGGELWGKTVGVVGLGSIGQRVAALCQAFGMEVIGCRRSGGGQVGDGYRVVEAIEEVAPLADHLVLAAALTPETRHIFDRRVVDRLKPGVHVVNVARGELIDNEALISGLERGIVRWASLDVVHPEPLPDGHPLTAMENVRISPHSSGMTDMTSTRHMAAFYENLGAYLHGGELTGMVSRDKGY